MKKRTGIGSDSATYAILSKRSSQSVFSIAFFFDRVFLNTRTVNWVKIKWIDEAFHILLFSRRRWFHSVEIIHLITHFFFVQTSSGVQKINNRKKNAIEKTYQELLLFQIIFKLIQYSATLNFFPEWMIYPKILKKIIFILFF